MNKREAAAHRCAAIEDFGLLATCALDYYRVHRRLPSRSYLKGLLGRWAGGYRPGDGREAVEALAEARRAIEGGTYESWLKAPVRVINMGFLS